MYAADEYLLITELHARVMRLVENVRPDAGGYRTWEDLGIRIGEHSHNMQVCIGVRLHEIYSWRIETSVSLESPRVIINYKIKLVEKALKILRAYMVLDDIASA